MSRYLLDTAALIDFAKGREPVRSQILEMIDAGDELGVCAVSVAEFYAGLPVAEQPQWDAFFAALRYWEITRQASRQAGVWHQEYSERGIPLTITDLLIAAVALEQHATLLSNDASEESLDEANAPPP